MNDNTKVYDEEDENVEEIKKLKSVEVGCEFRVFKIIEKDNDTPKYSFYSNKGKYTTVEANNKTKAIKKLKEKIKEEYEDLNQVKKTMLDHGHWKN
ncbi:MAG: hypothetical protein ACOCP8_05210 [archaeon]